MTVNITANERLLRVRPSSIYHFAHSVKTAILFRFFVKNARGFLLTSAPSFLYN